MQIDFANLKYQYKEEIDSVLDKSNYIMGEEVTSFGKNLENNTAELARRDTLEKENIL